MEKKIKDKWKEALKYIINYNNSHDTREKLDPEIMHKLTQRLSTFRRFCWETMELDEDEIIALLSYYSAFDELQRFDFNDYYLMDEQYINVPIKVGDLNIISNALLEEAIALLLRTQRRIKYHAEQKKPKERVKK